MKIRNIAAPFILLLASGAFKLGSAFHPADEALLYAREAYDEDDLLDLQERDELYLESLFTREPATDSYLAARNYLSKRVPMHCTSCGVQCIQDAHHAWQCPNCNKGRCLVYQPKPPSPVLGSKNSEYSKSGRKRVKKT